MIEVIKARYPQYQIITTSDDSFDVRDDGVYLMTYLEYGIFDEQLIFVVLDWWKENKTPEYEAILLFEELGYDIFNIYWGEVDYD